MFCLTCCLFEIVVLKETGKKIPCYFKRSYAEILLNTSTPDSRFTDNKDGTVTDNLTKLVWLKNTNCFGMLDWHRAIEVVKIPAEGACGPDPDLLLSDGSSAGDWRLPAMMELCTLIDYPWSKYPVMFGEQSTV